MDLKQGTKLSTEIVQILSPFSRRIAVAGSIRRRRDIVHDIDIVLIPGNQGALAIALRSLGPKIKAGPAIYSCRFKGAQVDIYIASELTWATLLLIRTGAKEHNIKMCSRAKELGFQLHADGSGISKGDGSKCAPKTEEELFAMLNLEYVRPERRN